MAEKRLFNLNPIQDVPDDQSNVEFKTDTTTSTNPFKNIMYKFTESMIFVGETVSTISVLLGRKLFGETVKGISRLRGRMLPHAKSMLLILQLALIRLCEPGLKVIRGVGIIRQRAQLAGAECRRSVCTDKKLCTKADCSSCIRKASVREAFKATGELAWESRKLLTGSVNYVAPVFAAVFFIGIVRYASDLEYAVNIRYNGQDLGYIAAESDYDVAEQAVQQKISYVAGNETVTFTPKLSLKIIQNAEYINPTELADKLITNSESALIEGYGFYLDGQFCGAVTDKTEIERALSSMLEKYNGIENAKDIAFVKTPSFEQSIFLADSIVSQEEIIGQLSSDITPAVRYVLGEDDTVESVAQRYNTTKEKLEHLNPELDDKWDEGLEILISAPEAYMPVRYTVESEFVTPIAFSRITLEDDTKYEGYKETAVRGKDGELTNIKENVFVNGNLVESEIVSSVITKEAITENVIVGTKKSSSYTTVVPSYEGPLELHGSTTFIWPCGPEAKYSRGFGYKSDGFHGAIDIAGPVGTDIYAAQDGVVVLAGSHYSYGNYVVVDHGYNDEGIHIATLYAHASKIYCETGDFVEAGDIIAAVGNTGDSRGNHLHFEVRIDGVRVDPELYLNRP